MSDIVDRLTARIIHLRQTAIIGEEAEARLLEEALREIQRLRAALISPTA